MGTATEEKQAKISFDVTGFTVDDIDIQIIHDDDDDDDNNNLVIHVSGKRQNRLGDIFVLNRKFRLNGNAVVVADGKNIYANLDGDGVLEIVVQKKKKNENDGVVGTAARTIPLTTKKKNVDDDEEKE